MAVKKNKIIKTLSRELSLSRKQHTKGVAYTAMALAMRYEYDLKKAEYAGLLHDIAKDIPPKRALRLCEKWNISYTDVEKRNPYLLHAKLGAYYALSEFGIEDTDILNAIIYHTTGRPNMSLLEKIIFVADYIEPHRDRAIRLKEIRRLAFIDIDETVYEITGDILAYLKRIGGEIDPQTYRTYEFYKQLKNARSKGDDNTENNGDGEAQHKQEDQ